MLHGIGSVRKKAWLLSLILVFAHGYLRASTSKTHAQVSETARTGAADHFRESGWEFNHALLWEALGTQPYHK